MRISDWSSDVCSSDLLMPSRTSENSESDLPRLTGCGIRPAPLRTKTTLWPSSDCTAALRMASGTCDSDSVISAVTYRPGTPDERRVGHECVCTCVSLWSPYIYTNKILTKPLL